MQDFLKRRFELSRGGGSQNVRPMEGVRGMAVILVFLVHYVTLINPWISGAGVLTFAKALHAIGNTGVDLFFVLSGYLIYGSLIARPQRFFRFMSRRIVRIYPAFISVLLVYLVLSFVFPAENKIPSAPLQAYIYIAQNLLLLPGLCPIEPIITVAWSLSYEMFYYLAIPLLITLLRLRQRSSRWRVCFFFALAAAMVAYRVFYGGPVRLVMFISGILLHEALESRKVPIPNSFVGLLALMLGFWAVLLPMAGYVGFAFKTSILFASFFLFCISCFGSSQALLPRAFSWTPLRWLGNMSYSYYLLHGLVLKAIFLFLPSVLPKDTGFGGVIFLGLLLPMFLLTLLPAAALFLGIERPFSLSPRGESGKSTTGALSEDARGVVV